LQNSAGARWMNYLLSLCLKEIPAAEISTIADMGCGIGIKSALMAQHFKSAKVFGFDFSANGISMAKKHYSNITNLEFSTSDITQNLHEKYDLICAFDVLEHIDKWEEIVKKIIVISNKYILFSFPTGKMREYEEKIGHFRNFKRNEVENFMSIKGWAAVKAIYAGFPFYSPIIRDLQNLFYDENKPVTMQKMTVMNKLVHRIWYILFRYFSSKKIGDNTLLLFKKIQENEGN
jgi:SAM-dependent methyltransferase